jgi:hypothetical protein
MTDDATAENKGESAGAGGEEAENQSRLQRYDKRIERWIADVRDEIEREVPEALDDLAKQAKGLAQYFEDKAKAARAKRATKEGSPATAEQSEATVQEIDKPSAGTEPQ